jgi:hypothetical protein
MKNEQKIKSWIEKTEIVNVKWGSVADRALYSILHLENISNLSMSKLLSNIKLEQYESGKEPNRHNTLYIFLKTKNVGSRTYAKYENLYLTIKRDFLKLKIQEKLFPDHLVLLDSHNLQTEQENKS